MSTEIKKEEKSRSPTAGSKWHGHLDAYTQMPKGKVVRKIEKPVESKPIESVELSKPIESVELTMSPKLVIEERRKIPRTCKDCRENFDIKTNTCKLVGRFVSHGNIRRAIFCPLKPENKQPEKDEE